MRQFTQQITLMGKVVEIDEEEVCFKIQCRSGDEFYCYANSNETRYYAIKNLEEKDDERFNNGTPLKRMTSAIRFIGQLVSIEGTLYINSSQRRVDVRRVNLMYNEINTEVTSPMVFETNTWWVDQIQSLADRWLFALFGAKSEYDFNEYRSYMDINFKPVNDLQETATLSRLIYGLSSAYLITGCERYLKAARNGVKYQREHFRNFKDGFCFWSFGKHANSYSHLYESQDGDDAGTIPLYEQIYALAGLTQYYRITLDQEVFDDIYKTVLTFNEFYKDKSGHRGYFSHLDPTTYRCDTDFLGKNKAQKNWNSIGDHIPAYLINLMIVLEPLANTMHCPQLKSFLTTCEEILKETSELIVEKFPETTLLNGTKMTHPFVNERFTQSWEPITDYSWQQDRGIVGHNLKIAWNLTRVANFYESRGKYPEFCTKAAGLCKHLANSMVEVGAIDLFRGGCFDALERNPKNNMSKEFAWLSTKDFWQQEQGILAYFILYGKTKDVKYLELAQEMSAFWNISFLDRQVGGVYFRTNDNGEPVVKGSYGNKAAHAISGYHAFELCYLAHTYCTSYVNCKTMSLFFKPTVTTKTALGILPDYVKMSTVCFDSVTINGVVRVLTPDERKGYFIHLKPEDNGANIMVQLSFGKQDYVQEMKLKKVEVPQVVKDNRKIGILIESHYDEKEVRLFKEFFAKNNYEIEFISNLWNQPKLEFYGNDFNDAIRVRTDVTKLIDADLSAYRGFILVGGYAMDRLRYEANPKADKGNSCPAVQFIRRVMSMKTIKVGVICHSAWLLTAAPELLTNRSLTCAHNLIYDVKNAKGNVVFGDNGTVDIHVDQNLISGKHPEVAQLFAETFLDELRKQEIALPA